MTFANTEKTVLARNWCIARHHETNHTYDRGIGYGYHLAMVAQLVREHCENVLRPEQCETAVAAAWAHDVIEDARQTYNDVKKVLGKDVAEIAYKLTNNRGRNREERSGGDYYPLIRSCPIATLVKCCDRLANIKYAKRRGSGMYHKYVQEMDKFIEELTKNAGRDNHIVLDYMADILRKEVQ